MDSVIRCIAMGAEDFLPKPFDPLLLRARTGACLEKKQLRDQEIEYLQQVARLTAAAAGIETGEFIPETLDAVAARCPVPIIASGGPAGRAGPARPGLSANGARGDRPRAGSETAGSSAAHRNR